MQKVEKRLSAIIKKCKNSGINPDQLVNLNVVGKLSLNSNKFCFQIRDLCIGVLFVVILSCWLILQTNIFENYECLIDMPVEAPRIFRKSEDCKICQNVEKIDKVTNISVLDFDKSYASLSKPVVIMDGAHSWPALQHFSFDFFKSLYETVDNNVEKKNCQFFPYKTEFKSLDEVFNMTPQRAKLDHGEKPWYIGWSNCNDKAGSILRKYYDTPYFLPNTSENMALNWIFMGGPGYGAHMHVDNVEYPSWQAQLSGRKKWILAPPPECIYTCKTLEVIVEPGEIIVVDTNRWYHQTNILSGKISITLGSEFD